MSENQISEEMLGHARWVLMGHAIGTDLGEDRKGRLVQDIARLITRIVEDERECCAIIADEHAEAWGLAMGQQAKVIAEAIRRSPNLPTREEG
jgi:hypothetical protein